MSQKKEMLTEILATLAAIKSDRTDDLTAIYWRAKYLRDASWLLKQLADCKKAAKEIQENVGQIQIELAQAEKVSQELMAELREIIEEMNGLVGK